MVWPHKTKVPDIDSPEVEIYDQAPVPSAIDIGIGRITMMYMTGELKALTRRIRQVLSYAENSIKQRTLEMVCPLQLSYIITYIIIFYK